MTGILLVILCVICVLCAYARWRKQADRLDEPPLYPGAWPVLGHILSVIGSKKGHKFVQQVALDLNRGEGVCSLLAGHVKFYAVSNPNDSLIIANQCLEKSIYYKFAKTWMGDSLLTSDSATWKKDRKMLMPAFNCQSLVGFLGNFNKTSRQVVEKLSSEVGKGSFDHLPFTKEYAMDTLCNTVLGIDIYNKQEYIQRVETLMDIILKRSLISFLHIDTLYNWTNFKKTEEKYTEFMHQIANEMIKKKRSEIIWKSQNNEDVKRNFLSLLLDISTREAMTDKKMRDQLNLMITAGYDTISNALVYMLVMIGSHKNVQEKAYKEIIEVFGDSCEDVEQTDLDRLVYLEAVIKETMRLCPPVPIVVREVTEDIKLENYTLYAGHSCLLLLNGVNMHPVWGDDVQLFKPERWLHPSTVPDHPAAFGAFSIGKRNCIGKYYAMMSMKTFLVHVLREYVITADWTQMEFYEDILLRVESGHHISLQRRS